MTPRTLAAAIVTILLLRVPGNAQSAADLLQRGIYTQETTGDIDGAIKIYRQVVESAGTNPGNNINAAQAQYRLVLCMLLKGQPTSALTEFHQLEQKFPAQQELVTRARAILPGSATTLPVPWGETEVSQLNIKRDGMPTGETLYYSIDPVGANTPHQSVLKWELKTKASTRGITYTVDSDSLRPVNGRSPFLSSTDDFGDAAADAFGGPAIDLEGSVFMMRRLPLAAGFKTTIPTTSFTLGSKVPKQVELAVTGIEPVQVTAGRFNCYKVSIAALGETFWFGIDGARPLVKFQSGKVEAELMKVWGPGSGLEAATEFLTAAGWKTGFPSSMSGWRGNMNFNRQDVGFGITVDMTKVYTPAAEIPEALRQVIPDQVKKHQGADFKVRPDSVRTRLIGGQQALTYIADLAENNQKSTYYELWMRTENSSVEFSASSNGASFAVVRWWAEPIFETARIP